jgi:hypothetical protein
MGLPFCFQHRVKELNIKVAPSTIPNAGKGLFADNGTHDNAIVFEKNDKITTYYGDIVNRNTIIDRYGTSTAPYGLEITKNKYTDGAMKRGLGTLIKVLILVFL